MSNYGVNVSKLLLANLATLKLTEAADLLTKQDKRKLPKWRPLTLLLVID